MSTDADFTVAVWLLPRVQAGGEENRPLWVYRCSGVNFTSTVAWKVPRDKEKDKEGRRRRGRSEKI